MGRSNQACHQNKEHGNSRGRGGLGQIMIDVVILISFMNEQVMERFAEVE